MQKKKKRGNKKIECNIKWSTKNKVWKIKYEKRI